MCKTLKNYSEKKKLKNLIPTGKMSFREVVNKFCQSHWWMELDEHEHERHSFFALFFWKQLGPCLLGAWGGESVSDFFFFFLSFSFSLFSFSFFCFLGFMRRASDLDFSLFTFLPLGLGNYNKEAQRTMRQRQFFKQYSSHTIKKTLRKILKCWV